LSACASRARVSLKKVLVQQLRMPVVDINNIAETDFRHAQPASDIDTAAVDGLKALDPDLPIREADIGI
jgi:hypothetical protein